MDPECCWNRLLNMLMGGNEEEAMIAARDMAAWIDKGGYIPKGLKEADDNRYIPGMGIKQKELSRVNDEEDPRILRKALRLLVPNLPGLGDPDVIVQQAIDAAKNSS